MIDPAPPVHLAVSLLGAEDAEAQATVARLVHRAFGEEYRETLADIEAYVAATASSARDRVFVARRGGAIVGTAALVDDDELPGFNHLHPWLASVVVEPRARRGGVASRLVAAVVEAAAARGDAALHLYTRLPGFYADRGFMVIDHAELRGVSYRVMARRLRPPSAAA